MADSAEKGFVAVPMNPEDHPKGQDPPPYTGPTVAWLSAPPHVLQPCVRDAVQLTVPIAPPPRDYVLWSFVSAMVCNFYCLGFAALAFSVKVSLPPASARSRQLCFTHSIPITILLSHFHYPLTFPPPYLLFSRTHFLSVTLSLLLSVSYFPLLSHSTFLRSLISCSFRTLIFFPLVFSSVIVPMPLF